MLINSDQTTNLDQPVVYQIRIKGHLGLHWTDWFEGLTITLDEDGNTILTGPVIDQSALHGFLKKVRDLNMPLVSVNRVQFNKILQTVQKREKMNTNKKTARLAGSLYLIYIAFHVFADVIGRSPIIVYGDAAKTAMNIMVSAWQFRVGFTLDLIAALIFLLTAWALYTLLKPVNKDLALLFLLLNLIGVAIQCTSDLFLPASQLVLSGADFLNVFKADQLQALVMSFLYLYKYGFTIAQVFYGAWLFPLGYTVFKSGFLPRILGIVLMIHCATWLMTSLQFFLFPGFTAISYVSYPLGFAAEFGLTLWLVIKGVQDQK